MAHPKSRISKSRKKKRRTHYKAEVPTLATCSATGMAHIYHRAYWYEGSLYHKGKVVMQKDNV